MVRESKIYETGITGGHGKAEEKVTRLQTKYTSVQTVTGRKNGENFRFRSQNCEREGKKDIMVF